MNFEILILLSVAVCALALPVPDEEVSTLQKTAEVAETPVTSLDELVKPQPTLVTLEEGTNTVGTVTVENRPKTDIDSELGTPTEGKLETSSVADEDIKEVPKSLPVLAGIVPPVSEVRAEPKEGVEIAEAKSSASSPGEDETDIKPESKTTAGEVQTTTEVVAEKKDEATTIAVKPKVDATESSTPASPTVAGENNTEHSALPAADNKTPSPKVKPTESTKHDHSSEGNKSEESAESKESEESNESKKN